MQVWKLWCLPLYCSPLGLSWTCIRSTQNFPRRNYMVKSCLQHWAFSLCKAFHSDLEVSAGQPLSALWLFVTSSHCDFSDIPSEANTEDHLNTTHARCPQAERESQHHRGRGPEGAISPLLGQEPAPVALLGLHLTSQTKLPTASSLHCPLEELLVPICPTTVTSDQN